MRLPVLRVRIVNVVRRNQRDSRFAGQANQLLIHRLLDAEPVVLELEKKVLFAEDIAVAERCLPGVLVAVHRKASRHLAR